MMGPNGIDSGARGGHRVFRSSQECVASFKERCHEDDDEEMSETCASECECNTGGRRRKVGISPRRQEMQLETLGRRRVRPWTKEAEWFFSLAESLVFTLTTGRDNPMCRENGAFVLQLEAGSYSMSSKSMTIDVEAEIPGQAEQNRVLGGKRERHLRTR